jgi:hypothetical protein
MGMKIEGPDDGPTPRRTSLVMECDEASEFFCRGSEIFDQGEFKANWDAAMAAGWLERIGSDRRFLCPTCSGKRARKASGFYSG